MASGDCFVRLDELDTLVLLVLLDHLALLAKKKRALIENSLCDSAGARTQERAETSLFIAKIVSRLGESTIFIKISNFAANRDISFAISFAITFFGCKITTFF